MWPSIKRWRDWAMNDLWPLFRSATGPPPQALHVSSEKAGLTLENQPVPWSAEAVVVEAGVRLSASAARNKTDFTLRLAATGQALTPESLRQDEPDAPARLFFRFPVPPHDTRAELLWRGRILGEVEISVLTADSFLAGLSLQLPTVHVNLASHTVVCQTFVNAQCQGLTASAVLNSATSLAPLADLDLRVELAREDGTVVETVPLRLSSSQLRARQALVTAAMPKPRRAGTLMVRWLLGQRELAAQKVRGITRKQFLRSLRISATRFVLQRGDELSVVRSLPVRDGQLDLNGVVRLGPCFLVSSNEPGMAGLAMLHMHAQVNGAVRAPLVQEQEVLITDGPLPFIPGTLEVGDLEQVQHFALESPEGRLGLLPLSPAPLAHFNSEGGFTPSEEFVWSSAAEEQLNEKLSKLLGGS